MKPRKTTTRRDFLLGGATILSGAAILKIFHNMVKADRNIIWSQPLIKTGGRRGEVKKAIENYPDVSNLEIGFYKDKTMPGHLKVGSLKRYPDRTSLHIVLPEYKSEIHTHPLRTALSEPNVSTKNALKWVSYPSSTDILHFIKKPKSSNIKFMHVIPVDTKGKVMGSTTVFATKKFKENLESSEELKKLIKQIEGFRAKEINGSSLEHYFSLFGQLPKFGLKVKLVPSAEYECKLGYFRKREV
ncbi:MAG TPA: hypothetical protein VJG83_01595 [archaeon]|nr:hypothetical protein [archaeon]